MGPLIYCPSDARMYSVIFAKHSHALSDLHVHSLLRPICGHRHHLPLWLLIAGGLSWSVGCLNVHRCWLRWWLRCCFCCCCDVQSSSREDFLIVSDWKLLVTVDTVNVKWINRYCLCVRQASYRRPVCKEFLSQDKWIKILRMECNDSGHLYTSENCNRYGFKFLSMLMKLESVFKFDWYRKLGTQANFSRSQTFFFTITVHILSFPVLVTTLPQDWPHICRAYLHNNYDPLQLIFITVQLPLGKVRKPKKTRTRFTIFVLFTS